STIDHTSEKQVPSEAKQAGNYQFLTDTELDSAFVKDPFSDKKGKELKMINIYTKQIADAIFANWTNPLTPSEIKEGASVKIRFQINENGFVEKPYVYLKSRFPQLDNSLMLAINKIMGFQFEISSTYLEKYKYLSLSWASDGTKYELMPFEKESNQEK
ncbi:MAG: TonB C-terminal domain-containing protein, partial [Oleiphilus sp.]